MARKGSQYSDAQLADMYREYAERKGWNTSDEVVRDKIDSWRDSSIGPVGLAIDFHETGEDNAKHLGKNAEHHESDVERRAGCATVLALFLIPAAALAFWTVL